MDLSLSKDDSGVSPQPQMLDHHCCCCHPVDKATIHGQLDRLCKVQLLLGVHPQVVVCIHPQSELTPDMNSFKWWLETTHLILQHLIWLQLYMARGHGLSWVVLSCLYVHKARALWQLLTKFFAVVLRNTVRTSTLKYAIFTSHAKVINHQFKSRHAWGQ